jgi:hypothetical protein
MGRWVEPWLPVVFAAENLAVLPFWAMMILLPGWRVTRRVMDSPWSVAWLPCAYVLLLLPELSNVLPLFLPSDGPPTLRVVRELLSTDYGTTIAWLHLLAFDLFVGRWIYRDGQQRRVSPLLVGPVLAFTLLFGPAGLLGWLLLRALGLAGHDARPAP